MILNGVIHIRATAYEKGIAELRFAENINELILVTLEGKENIESKTTKIQLL